MQRKVSFPNYFNPLSLAETGVIREYGNIAVFQSTPLSLAETGVIREYGNIAVFQSTPLSLAETVSTDQISSSMSISIHSAIASRDAGVAFIMITYDNFNPLRYR